MTKPRVLVITGCQSNEDKDWDIIFQSTLKSKIKYCNIHNYDIYITTKFTKDPYGIFNESDLGFLRTVLILEINKQIKNINKYDYIFWLDGDTIITNPSYDIEYFINQSSDSCYYASYDWGSNSKTYHSFNNGNWIVKVGDQAEELYKYFLNIARKFPNEQEALNFLSRTQECNKYFTILEKNLLNSVPNHENLIENRNNQKIDVPWKDNDFLCHFSGLSNQQRIYLIEKYFNSYI